MSSFADLKRNSSSNFDKLSKAAESLSSNKPEEDSNYWKASVDSAGNGYAIIRFLPSPPQDEDGIPWVSYFDHGFKGPNGWFIDKCLTSPTISGDCPVCQANRDLWNSGIESNKKIVSERKRKQYFVSNIYVVKDSKNPENEGKVFLFKYGKKIHEKLLRAMKPQFEDDVKIQPFDLWEGANFKLKIRKFEGYQNYDLSEFESPSPLVDDDAKLEKIWRSEYSLKEIVDPKVFKSYDDLKKRLDRVLGNAPLQEVVQQRPQSSFEEPAKTPRNTFGEIDKSIAESDPFGEEDDEDLSYFRNMIDED